MNQPPESEISAKELANRFGELDPQALRIVFRYLYQLYTERWFSKFGPKGDEVVLDAIFDSMWTVFKKMHTKENGYEERGTFYNYLRTIYFRRLNDLANGAAIRHFHAATDLPYDLEEDYQPEPESMQDLFDRSPEHLDSHFHRWYDQLQERDRRILHHRFVDGMSNIEIAKKVGIQVNALNNRIHRALKRLRKSLKAEKAKRTEE